MDETFKRMKQAAAEIGLRSNKEIAEKVGVSQQAITNWKTRGVPGTKIVDVARALGVSAEWLKTGKGPKTTIYPPPGHNLMGFDADDADKLVKLQFLPTVEWEKEEDLAEHGDYVFVPRIDIKASCGDGACVVHEEEKDQRQAFRAEWFAEKGIRPQYTVCIYAEGDSMEPRIFEGDTLLIDRSPAARERIINGKIYLIRYGDEIRVKQLFKHVDGSLTIRSFNRDKYPDEQLPPSVLENGGIEILGRVVWIGGEL